MALSKIYFTEDGSHDYDLSGTTIEEDPQFANPAVGDFHISRCHSGRSGLKVIPLASLIYNKV